MLYVVRVIVYLYIGAVLIESVDKHTFFVKVGEAYRSDNLFHSQLFSPLEKFGKQSFGNLEIVYYVKTGKPQLL